MKTSTKIKLKNQIKKDFALGGIDNINIRKVASEVGTSTSIIYHYFDSQNQLLKEVFDDTKKQLGLKRKTLKTKTSTKLKLKQRILFQFKNAEDVVFILKYYTHFRKNFSKNNMGYVPKEAYTHILEVLKYGVKQGEFKNVKLQSQAKMITHCINGFVLEYYPKTPKDKALKVLATDITNFIYRAIIKGGDKYE